jgi:hypothetical protein
LKRERGYLQDRSQKQSARAKSRWNKEKDPCRSDATEHDPAYAPTPTPLKKETPKPLKGVGDSLTQTEQKESPARPRDGDGSAAPKSRSPPPTEPPNSPPDEPDDIPFEKSKP